MSRCPPKTVCPTKKCDTKFKDKLCKCVTILGNSCEPIKNVCAYKENGTLLMCPSGCCQNQCEGICDDTEAKAKSSKLQAISTKRYILAIIVLFITLALISTVSLL
jgi:hypothetical protein